MPGWIVLLVVLVIVAVGGALYAARNGSFRAAGSSTPLRTASGAASGVSSGVSSASDGIDGHSSDEAATDDSASQPALTSDDLGEPLGERATMVQFSSAFCAPCRAARRVLGSIADITPGVSHIEIDAESHLDLVRRLNILRTPTIVIIDADGVIRQRASGLPKRDQVMSALADVV